MTPTCVVCRTPLPDDPHLCPRCETPHHLDCWEYTGGCAIYGCANRAQVPVRQPPPVWQPGERMRGAVFGAFLGFAVTAAAFSLALRSTGGALAALIAGMVAALNGAGAGATVRDVERTGGIFFWGTAGTGIGAWVLNCTYELFHRPENLSAAPFILIGFLFAGLLMTPIALPITYLISRFNDPRLKHTARQFYGTLAVVAASLLLVGAILCRVDTLF